MENAIGSVELAGIGADKIKNIRLVRDGTELKIAKNWIVDNYPDSVFVDISETAVLPDPIDTVVKVNLK